MATKYSGGGPSYMKGYTGKGGRNGRKKNNFSPIIVVIILIIIAIFAYCSIGSDNDEINDGDNVVATAAPTAKPTTEPTEEPAEEDDLYATPSPTLTADDTVGSYDLENVPTAKPKTTAKPKATSAPTEKPVSEPTAVPTNIPSSAYGTAYVNKYYTSGIYVRSGAGTENSVVLHIKRDDHTTRLVPTGNTQADAEGYTWIEVTVPSGAIGWVRSDVVAQQ